MNINAVRPDKGFRPGDTETADQVMQEVLMERDYQDAKWGVQDRSPVEWLAILAEEFGEVSQEVVDIHFGREFDFSNYRKELVQLAAVAAAAVECLDRRVRDGDARRAKRRS